MTLLWFITGASLLIALVAVTQARRTARRLEQLTQMFWELKYQQGELRVQLRQRSGETPPAAAPETPPPPAEAFVPLTSIKR